MFATQAAAASGHRPLPLEGKLHDDQLGATRASTQPRRPICLGGSTRDHTDRFKQFPFPKTITWFHRNFLSALRERSTCSPRSYLSAASIDSHPPAAMRSLVLTPASTRSVAAVRRATW